VAYSGMRCIQPDLFRLPHHTLVSTQGEYKKSVHPANPVAILAVSVFFALNLFC